jgi:hypothetical protein
MQRLVSQIDRFDLVMDFGIGDKELLEVQKEAMKMVFDEASLPPDDVLVDKIEFTRVKTEIVKLTKAHTSDIEFIQMKLKSVNANILKHKIALLPFKEEYDCKL